MIDADAPSRCSVPRQTIRLAGHRLPSTAMTDWPVVVRQAVASWIACSNDAFWTPTTNGRQAATGARNHQRITSPSASEGRAFWLGLGVRNRMLVLITLIPSTMARKAKTCSFSP
jgi:hypothetical protein